MVYDYKKEVLLKRAESTFEDDARLGSCGVVGLTVESALRLHWKPGPGKLPVPLEQQTFANHPSVLVARVLLPGGQRVTQATVGVYEDDADLALRATSAFMKKLEGEGMQLQVVCVDQRNEDAPGKPSHDIITQPVAQSPLKKGFYSVEIRCREVTHRRALIPSNGINRPWIDTREEECEPPWKNELGFNSRPWAAKILVLVEFGRPCHESRMRTHGSILWKKGAAWSTLWGWSGFLPRQRGQAAPPSAPVVVPRVPSPARVVSCAPLLQMFRKKGIDVSDDDNWVLLSVFLEFVKEAGGHSRRYVDGASTLSWNRQGGGKPRLLLDYTKRPGPRGGGCKGGLLHCRLSFLKMVYLRHYAK